MLLIWGTFIQSLQTRVSSSVKGEARITYKAIWSRAGVGEFFSVNDQVTNILDFGGYMTSGTATQLCPCSIKVTIDNI